ncbi:hypothetical protein D3C86_2025920 [compost metagenome]
MIEHRHQDDPATDAQQAGDQATEQARAGEGSEPGQVGAHVGVEHHGRCSSGSHGGIKSGGQAILAAHFGIDRHRSSQGVSAE